MVGLGGLEPPTSRLSGVRSNQLSYRPLSSENSLQKFGLPASGCLRAFCGSIPSLKDHSSDPSKLNSSSKRG
jgi:hypothetical protein